MIYHLLRVGSRSKHTALFSGEDRSLSGVLETNLPEIEERIVEDSCDVFIVHLLGCRTNTVIANTWALSSRLSAKKG